MFKMTVFQVSILTLSFIFSQGCSHELTEGSENSVKLSGEQSELAFAEGEHPSVFSQNLTYQLEQLPREGEATISPWPAYYFPHAVDSINYHWDKSSDSMSASEKYGHAFNVAGVEDAVSALVGIDSIEYFPESGSRMGKPCNDVDDCSMFYAGTGDYIPTGDMCAKRRGESTGKCITPWYGLCHAWAPASILFPEPQHSVFKNGIEFKVNDIKALLTIVHNETTSALVGSRCEGSQYGIDYDPYGRPIDPECINTNPATLHVLLGNYLGLQGKSFIMDRTFDSQIWNQPLHSYEVKSLSEVSASRANALIAQFNDSHYYFNGQARRFFEVKTDVNWITESHPIKDTTALTSRIRDFVETEHYHYILEADANGKLIGGEWLGDSKRHHPDFLWLASGPDSSSVASIDYADIVELARLSSDLPAAAYPTVSDYPTEQPIETEYPVEDTYDYPAEDTYDYPSDNFPSGEQSMQWVELDIDQDYMYMIGPIKASGGNFTVSINGSGNADLYVSNRAYADFSEMLCDSAGYSSAESCSLSAAGDYYVYLLGTSSSYISMDLSWDGDLFEGEVSYEHMSVISN